MKDQKIRHCSTFEAAASKQATPQSTAMFPPARKRRATDPEWSLKPSRHQHSTSDGSGPTQKKKKGGGSRKSSIDASANDADAPLVKKKILGVRRVLSKPGDEDDIITNPREYHHGHDNAIISSLIASNPRIIGLALSARDPLGALSDDYILSLLHSRGQNEIRRDNPGRRSVSAASAASAGGSGAGGAGQKPASASSNKKKADKILGSLGLDDADPSLRRDVENLVMRRTNSVSATMDNEDSLIGGEDEDTENYDQILRTEELYLRDVLESMGSGVDGASGDENSDDDANDDGLTWLSKEMEREYRQFLKFSADGESDKDGDENDGGGKEASAESSVARGKAKYRFKATITLSRGVNCHLGLFHSMEDACEAVDKATLARRTLGKKLLEEHQIRRAVKSRKAALQETTTALERDRVTPAIAAKRAQVAATHAFTEVKVEAFLTSDKVMQPELNWDGRIEEFYKLDDEDDEELGLDDDAAEALALKRANLEGLEKLASAMLDSDRAGIALEMVMKDIDMPVPDLMNEDPIIELGGGGGDDDELAAAAAEYQELTTSLRVRGEELKRLIQLEQSVQPLLEEDAKCCDNIVSSFVMESKKKK